MMTVHAHKSEDEARDISRRVLSSIARKAQKGMWFGWMPPYGLRVARDIDPATGKVLSRKVVLGPEEEVQAVQFIFDAVANRGWTLRRLCRELEARKVKPPVGNGLGGNKKDGRWNPGTVRNILTNRKYVGDLPYNEVHSGKYSLLRGEKVESYAGDVNRKTSRSNPEEVTLVPDAIPAIIDRNTFARAGAALAQSKYRTTPNAETASYLFTHMLACSDCGAYLRGQPVRGCKAYICAKYKEYGTDACYRNQVNESDLKAAILGTLKNEVLSPSRLDAIEGEMERRLRAERSSGEQKRLQKQVAALDRDISQGNANLARLPEDRLPGVITQVRQWEAERGALLARLHDLEHGTDEAQKVLAEARKQLWRLRDALENDDEEAQATVIREVVSKIEVRFAHEQTHGRRSPTGTKRTLSRANGLVLYIRPGLGLSCLSTSDWQSRARGGA